MGPLKNRLDWSLETGRGMAKKVAATIEVIKDKEFDGNAALLAEDWIPLIVPNFDNLAPKYAENWQETPIAFLAAELSDDCATLDTITWVTEGKMFAGRREKALPANRVWNFKQKVTIRFDPLNLSAFKFAGAMCSDFLDSTAVKFHMLAENDTEIPLVDLAKQGFAGFSLRIFITPITTHGGKLYLYIYPYTKEKLLEAYKEAVRPEFPAVLVTTVAVELGVQQSGVILEKNVGCPLLPVIKTANPIENAAKIPSAGEVAWKVSAFLQKVVLPENKTTLKSLWERMAAVRDGGEAALKGAPAEKMWPDSVPPLPEDTGEYTI